MQDENGKQMIVMSEEPMETFNNSQQPTVVSSVNGFTPMQKPRYSESSNIKIVGIQDKKPSQITLSKPLQTKTSYSTYQPDNKQQIRQPRKQSLGTLAAGYKVCNTFYKRRANNLFYRWYKINPTFDIL